jgi:hypothetical protein
VPAPPAAGSGVTPFVGREREIATVAAALAAGLNVVLEGRYGSGRTALLRRVEEALAASHRFAFADGSLTASGICNQWLAALGGLESTAAAHRKPPRYLSARAALVRAPEKAGRRPVLVLDDLGRLTPAKVELIRRLTAGGGLRLVAVLEPFLPAAQRLVINAWLVPLRRLKLGPLSVAASRRFFTCLAAQHRLPWELPTVLGLARAGGGHPLAMWELATTAAAASGQRLQDEGA